MNKSSVILIFNPLCRLNLERDHEPCRPCAFIAFGCEQNFYICNLSLNHKCDNRDGTIRGRGLSEECPEISGLNYIPLWSPILKGLFYVLIEGFRGN